MSSIHKKVLTFFPYMPFCVSLQICNRQFMFQLNHFFETTLPPQQTIENITNQK